jgi:hypothetical protein
LFLSNIPCAVVFTIMSIDHFGRIRPENLSSTGKMRVGSQPGWLCYTRRSLTPRFAITRKGVLAIPRKR